jgi:hypothetical protein
MNINKLLILGTNMMYKIHGQTILNVIANRVFFKAHPTNA